MNPPSTHLALSATESHDSTQPQKAIQDTNLAANGVALVDADLRIVAADAVARSWINRVAPGVTAGGLALEALLEAAELPERARRTLDVGDHTSFPARLRGACEPLAQVQVALRRLEGPGAPLLVAILELAPAPEATSFDALTRLPDRRELYRRVAMWRRASPDIPPRFAVLFLDLDDFKEVNDRGGHAVGDAVLSELAARWANCIREGDLLCRYGGDEFVLLIRHAATMRDVAPVAARLREATAAPVRVNGVDSTVRATIGAAVATSSCESLDDLIAAADRDMYASKPRVLR